MIIHGLSISHPNDKRLYEVKKDQIVYVPVLKDDSIGDIESAEFYLKPEFAKYHFWFTTELPSKLRIEEMLFQEYIDMRIKEGGMNPFESLNMLEFKIKYLGLRNEKK
jgi:hypothetical protein